MTKEEVYDSQLNPLMTQIIDVCKEHDINMVCSFEIEDNPNVGDSELMCTTIIVDKEHAGQKIKKCAMAAYPEPEPAFAAFTVHRHDNY